MVRSGVPIAVASGRWLQPIGREVSGDVLVSWLRRQWQTPLYRSAYALTLSAGATSGLGMIFWLLAARHYSDHIVGISSAAIAAMTFLQGVSGLSLDGALIRFIPGAGRSVTRLVAYTFAVGALTSTVVSAVFLLGIPIWSPALAAIRDNLGIAVLFALLTIGSCNFILQDGALTGLRATQWVLAKNALSSFIKIVLLLVLVGMFPKFGIIVSWTIAVLVLLIPTNVLMFGRLIPNYIRERPTATPVERSRLTRYVGGNYVAFLFNLAVANLLPVLVLQEAGSRASAYFYFPWLIAVSLRLVPTNMSMSLVVEASMHQQGLTAYTRHALLHSARLIVPAACLLFVGAPFLLRIIGPAYAANGTPLLRLLALAAIPNMIPVLYVGMARVRHRIADIMAIQIAITSVQLALSYFLLPAHGLMAVGVVWLGLQTVGAVVLLLTRMRDVTFSLFTSIGAAQGTPHVPATDES